MDTAGGCASAAAHRVVDPAAAAPMGAKKRPHMTDGYGWTGTKKMNTTTPCSREYQVHGLESGEANSTAVVRSRKRSYEYSELEFDVASEKMFKCNYWEDPAYAKTLQSKGLKLARSAALDNNCSRLHKEHDAWMAGAAATPSD